jgi:two-component system chemotaxis response regulator CheY
MIDWVMPGMSGVELVSYLREQHTTKGTPVMMVTGQRDMRKVAEALKVGADEYIMKPFSRQIIEEKLRIIGIEPD